MGAEVLGQDRGGVLPDRLEELWETDEELRTEIDEDKWLEFMNNLYDQLEELKNM